MYNNYMEKTLEIHIKETREDLVKQIQAFAGDYSHNIDGREVIIVKQLLDFIKS